jgi:hypothetical protein
MKFPENDENVMKFSDPEDFCAEDDDSEEFFVDTDEFTSTFEKIPRKPKPLSKFREKDKGWKRRDKWAE